MRRSPPELLLSVNAVRIRVRNVYRRFDVAIRQRRGAPVRVLRLF
jgi:hypothetical protein